MTDGPRPLATTRARRRHATTLSILETSRRVLAAEGFEALTMHRLAAELGYTVGALYRYFPSKDALVVAVLGDVVETLRVDLERAEAAVARRLTRRGAEPGLRGLVQVLAAMATYESMADRHPEQFRLLATAIGDPREITATRNARAVVPRLRVVVEHVARFLGEASRHRLLRPGDAERRTVVLWAAVHGEILMRKFGRLGLAAFEPRGLVLELATGLLAGWGASEGIVKREWVGVVRTVRLAQRRAA